MNSPTLKKLVQPTNNASSIIPVVGWLKTKSGWNPGHNYPAHLIKPQDQIGKSFHPNPEHTIIGGGSREEGLQKAIEVIGGEEERHAEEEAKANSGQDA